MNQRELFLNHIAQTSPNPLAVEIVKAEGCSLFDVNGKEYTDLIGGISVANIGHRHPKVLEAIRQQLDAYLHIMVYGELIESPQVQYAGMLKANLPSSLNSVYFTNSGTEATEAAMKLAKRVTGRSKIIAFKNAYHGSTQGALSLMGSEYWRNAFRPLLPDIQHLEYNSFDSLQEITEQTAAVFAETVQGEAGVIVPAKEWMQALQKRCADCGSLLVLDAIQTGFGRTGRLWGFEQFEIVPDILLLGKALGGGMPLGAFIADKKIMMSLTHHPELGHITTFGGHPVCCAAGMAALNALLEEGIMNTVYAKENLFRSLLIHRQIKGIRSSGLLIAVEFDSFSTCKKVVDHCIAGGVFTDWFLFASHCLRMSPPLTITEDEIKKCCRIIIEAIESQSV